jgi:two-component system, NtrC family, sensor kinase
MAWPEETAGSASAVTSARSSGLYPAVGLRMRRVGLLVVGALALAVAVTSLVRTTRSFFVLDFGVTWVRGAIQVDLAPVGSSAQVAGLEEGDLIMAIDGVAVERLDDPLFVLAAGSHTLTVRGRFGDERQASFHAPPPRVDAVYLTRSLVAVFGLGCALWAVLGTRRREATTFLALAVASLVVAAIPHRTADAETALGVLHRAAGAGVPFLLLRFFAVFPERRPSLKLYDLLTVAAMAIAAATALVPGGQVWWPAVAAGLRGVFGIALAVGAALHVRRWRASIRVARVRRQIEWVALGMFIGLAPYAAVVVLPRWLGVWFEPFTWLAVLPVAAVPLGFLAALVEYRLWDLEPISRDLLSATLVVVAGGLIFSTTNRILLSYASDLGPLRNLVAFATGVLLVVLVQPMRQRVERFLDKWLYHGRPAPQGLLAQTAREFLRAGNSREVLGRLADVLHDGLEFELVATYVRRSDDCFHRVTASGDDAPEVLPGEVITAPYPTGLERLLADAGHALRLPLERGGTVHGLAYLGLRRGIFPLGSEAREVVTGFAAQAALALESARLFDDLRRQAEEYRILHANTQRIIESSAAGILVCDATGRILSGNAEAAELFGHDPATLVGMALEELVEMPVSWHPTLPLHAENAESVTRSDSPRRVVLAVSVLELDSGSFNGRVVVLQDVTELRDLQDRLREQERLAALGRLASGLAHEINTPLTGIASFAQMLGEMTSNDDPRAELVGKLVAQSFRVSRIVANLHAAVRGSRGDRVVFDLGDTAERAARDAARTGGAGDRIDVVRPGQAVMVSGAPGAVELAVSNLVRNAIEASPPETMIRVVVEARGSWGEVHVDDAGPGVPEEFRDKVFEPFFTTKTDRGGTGLGLAITRDMITQLDGEVAVSSSEMGGARASLRLPKWEAAEPSS